MAREDHQLSPFGFKLRVGSGGNVRMNRRARSLVRGSAVRVRTVPVRSLGKAVCFLCGVVRLRTAYQGGMCGQNVYWSLCATFFACVHAVRRVCVRYGVRLGQPKQCILYVYACMYGGRHVQPERCTIRREYVHVCMYNVWYGQPGRRK